MQMIPVESSNVAAIGWKDGLMTVEYRDGARYQYPNVEDATYLAIMASESKGRALAALLNAGEISKGVKLNGPDPGSRSVALQKPVSADNRINVSQAEGCCGVALNNASLSGALARVDSFECPRCGTEYRPTMFGMLANWEPVETAELLTSR